MILTQYEARDKYGMSITALQKKAKKLPRPRYFIDVVDGAPRIDDQHPEWTAYVRHLQDRKKSKDNKSSDLVKLIKIMGKILTEQYGEDEANEIKQKIILEFRS